MDTIGGRIVAKRKSLNLTQKVLSDKSTVSVPTISGIENGRRNANLATLILIAQAFNCSLDSLVFGEDGKSRPVPKAATREERILRAVGELVSSEVLFVHGDKGFDGTWDHDAYLEFTATFPREPILTFASSIQGLVDVRKSIKRVDDDFEKMVNEAVEQSEPALQEALVARKKASQQGDK